MKLFSSHEIEVGSCYPDKSWITHIKYYRMIGSEKLNIGWALAIWLPAYQWGPYADFGHRECWAQWCIYIQSVDFDRGLPSPWEWSYNLWARE